MRAAILIFSAVIVLALAINQFFYTVNETEAAVVTRFGLIKNIQSEPGLKTKLPFVDSVTRFDSRILRVDTPPATLPDKDLQSLVVDAYTRYRIVDVRKFFEKLRSVQTANDRIGRIVISALREDIARRSREEVIGSIVRFSEDGTSSIVPTNTRQEIMERVLLVTNASVKSPENDFGVEIIDVRMKRADFPEAVQQSIFGRMTAERERIAREFRAEGAEEDSKIRANVERERTILLADAERNANIARGRGEAEAIKILAEALQKDPGFYTFQRSLEAYKRFLVTNSTIVLSSESELFQFLKGPGLIQAGANSQE